MEPLLLEKYLVLAYEIPQRYNYTGLPFYSFIIAAPLRIRWQPHFLTIYILKNRDNSIKWKFSIAKKDLQVFMERCT